MRASDRVAPTTSYTSIDPFGTNDSTDLKPPRPSGTRSMRTRDCRPFSGKSGGSTVNVSPGRTPAAEPRLISTTPSGNFRRIFPCGSSYVNVSLLVSWTFA